MFFCSNDIIVKIEHFIFYFISPNYPENIYIQIFSKYYLEYLKFIMLDEFISMRILDVQTKIFQLIIFFFVFVD